MISITTLNSLPLPNSKHCALEGMSLLMHAFEQAVEHVTICCFGLLRHHRKCANYASYIDKTCSSVRLKTWGKQGFFSSGVHNHYNVIKHPLYYRKLVALLNCPILQIEFNGKMDDEDSHNQNFLHYYDLLLILFLLNVLHCMIFFGYC